MTKKPEVDRDRHARQGVSADIKKGGAGKG